MIKLEFILKIYFKKLFLKFIKYILINDKY